MNVKNFKYITTKQYIFNYIDVNVIPKNIVMVFKIFMTIIIVKL